LAAAAGIQTTIQFVLFMQIVELFLALILVLLIPVVLLGTGSWLLHRLDDRGMFEVPPFSWLPWVAGLILSWWMLAATGIVPALSTKGIWFSDFWSLPAFTAYRLWLSPWALLQAWGWGLHEAWTAILTQDILAVALLVILLTELGVAGLAWRSRQVWRGLVCFFWLLFAAGTLFYTLAITLAWIVHWLNFWVLLVIFAVLYFLSNWKGITPVRKAH